MSKWLRRGLGHANNNTFQPSSDERQPPQHQVTEFPTPPRNDMPAAASAAVYQPAPVAFPDTTVAMDIDPSGHSGVRNKYSPAPSNAYSSKPYDMHSAPRQMPDEQHRSSRRPSRRSGSSSQPQPQQPYSSYPRATTAPTGATNAPHTMTSPPPGHFGAHPPPPAFKDHLDSATPPDHHSSGQPSFPPPAVTADSPQPSEASKRRPAYLLHRDLVIGKGSYGQVCIASRGEPEGHTSGRSGKRKKFACKCVMLRNDPKYIAKLQEEVNVLRELRGHQNIIRLYDVFCVDNELFIITELGRGGDLFHLLTTHPKHGVTESYAAKTVSEMLSAVAFLHSRSICHRDLKLENWVLESGKDVWSPLKLIDFGLSTHFSSGQRLSRVVGSSYYVAPEVLKKSYTEACDLWSLGVIVYMLLSGAPPFYGKNDEAIKASIVQGEYTFPHELFRDVSDEAMAFVSTLLSYNIEYRYTAEQALTHPWLTANCDPEALQRAKDSARGIGIQLDNSRVEPMQM
jgi:calcium/calmodulin-dependent protein kinase I